MANRVKEDEKNERTIRSLLKLQENRRCINCNSVGPQYVCTNFWTFVCTTCSGIHREFTHRVKSVSVAKFTAQEVSALQGGGNASAKCIYFKEWDPHRNSLPDCSNVERLRDFIKHVYVDRRYTGERIFDKPPKVKMGETEDLSENRKMDSYLGARSPPYDNAYERRYSDKPSPGGRSDDRNYRNSYDERRSPGSDSDYGRSPAQTEIVNDWRREDRLGRKESEDSRISDGGSKLEGRSPDRQRDVDISSPPVVRPVRDILGENVSPLRVIEPPPKANGGKSADGSFLAQRTTSSSSLASSNGNPTEVRAESSLIDFDAVPEPPVAAAVPQTQQTATGLYMAKPTTSNDNWANFDSVKEVKVSQAPSNANLLESLLSELSVPAPFPGHSSGDASTTAPLGNMSLLPPSNSLAQPMGHVSVSPFGGGGPAAAPMGNTMAYPPSGLPAAAVPGPTSTSFFNVADGGQWNQLQTQQQILFPAGSQPPAQPFMSVVGGASTNQVPTSVSTVQVPQAVSGPAVEITSGVVKQPSIVEVRPTGKKELPQDLFTANYSSFAAPLPGWHIVPPHGFGFNMQYNTAAPVPTFSQPSRSSNPFDFNNEPSPVQASTFSMIPLQGALPNVAAPTGLLHTSSFGTPSLTWMPPQSSQPVAMASHAPTYASAVPPSSYMGQHVPSNMPPRQQGSMGFGFEQAAFGSLIQNQQPSGLYSSPVAPNTFSAVGGNPFG